MKATGTIRKERPPDADKADILHQYWREMLHYNLGQSSWVPVRHQAQGSWVPVAECRVGPQRRKLVSEHQVILAVRPSMNLDANRGSDANHE